MQFHKRLITSLAFSTSLLCGAVQAAPIFFDVDDLGTNNTQGGWTSTNLNDVNSVTFTSVGGAALDDRDRGTANTNGIGGDVANNEMWRDFIFARNTSAQESGMDITISGLLTNTYYDVKLWAFDEDSNTSNNAGRHMTWNGNALAIYNDGDPTSLNDQMVNFTAMTDATGLLTLEGRIGSSVGPCCNVFVNGFQIEAKEVSAPTTIALLGVSLIGMGLRRRKLK